MFRTYDDVYNWLTAQTRQRSPSEELRVSRRIERKPQILYAFVELGKILTTNSALVYGFLQNSNWRQNMVGNAIAILQGDSRFLPDIVAAIIRGSWVAPQLAAGFAILSDGTVTTPLEDCLEVATEESRPKTVLSAYAALKLIGHAKATDFEKTSLFEHLQSLDSDYCIVLADDYWQVWKKYKGLCTVEIG